MDMEPAHHEAHLRAAKVIGVELTLEQCLDGKTVPHFIGGPDEVVAKEIANLIPGIEVGSEQWQDSVRMFSANDKEIYERLMKQRSFDPRPGFWDVLGQLKNDIGYPVAIGSSTPPEYAEILLGRSGLLESFSRDRIVLGQKVKDGKAIPDVWVECAKRMNVSPDQLLVFEDSPRGIMGAVQVGADCIGMPVYNKPSVIQKLLEAGAVRVFMDWKEMNVYEMIVNLENERAKP
ncbi:MAG: phosphatase [Parcubacteria group bacterium Gr01-1014_19]|nr:MAG: phosphatase [Parcubacteria group bacterium Gr01-1014_19]